MVYPLCNLKHDAVVSEVDIDFYERDVAAHFVKVNARVDELRKEFDVFFVSTIVKAKNRADFYITTMQYARRVSGRG